MSEEERSTPLEALRRALGPVLARQATGAPDRQTYNAWIRGSDSTPEVVDRRARVALQVCGLVGRALDRDDVPKWFDARNTAFGDRTPAAFLGEAAGDRDFARCRAVAERFSGCRQGEEDGWPLDWDHEDRERAPRPKQPALRPSNKRVRRVVIDDRD